MKCCGLLSETNKSHSIQRQLSLALGVRILGDNPVRDSAHHDDKNEDKRNDSKADLRIGLALSLDRKPHCLPIERTTVALQ